VWGFVGAKEKNARRLDHDGSHGDAYCYIAVERETKLVYCFSLGKRSHECTDLFIEQLAECTTGEFQVSTDGFGPYQPTIWNRLRDRVSHGVLVKQYGNDPRGDGPRRYSPAAIIAIIKKEVFGDPDQKRICTSHVERGNLNVRMHCRRMTRLTNAFSKKFENHYAMLAIYFAWHNFVRPHMTLKTTPAVAHGIASEPWTIERLLNEAATAA
jgi:IS1 family transposase